MLRERGRSFLVARFSFVCFCLALPFPLQLWLLAVLGVIQIVQSYTISFFDTESGREARDQKNLEIFQARDLVGFRFRFRFRKSLGDGLRQSPRSPQRLDKKGKAAHTRVGRITT